MRWGCRPVFLFLSIRQGGFRTQPDPAYNGFPCLSNPFFFELHGYAAAGTPPPKRAKKMAITSIWIIHPITQTPTARSVLV